LPRNTCALAKIALCWRVVNGVQKERCYLISVFRKLGLIGVVFFIANALAAVTSLIILFMRGRRQGQMVSCRTCGVCHASIPLAAKYCQECGSRA
jgi:hypothetical protein